MRGFTVTVARPDAPPIDFEDVIEIQKTAEGRLCLKCLLATIIVGSDYQLISFTVPRSGTVH